MSDNPFVPDEDYSHTNDEDPIDDGYNVPEQYIENDAIEESVSEDDD